MKYLRAAAAVALVATLSACGRGGQEQPQPELRPVRYLVVQEESLSTTRRFSGVTTAEDELPIAFRVSGQLREVRVNTGSRVQEGQLLARLASDEYELEVQRAEAALESARAQFRTAQSSYQRVRQLYQNDSASRNQLESAQSSLEAAESNLVSAEAQAERARLQLSYTAVRAPFSGTIATRYVDPGAVVGAGQAILALSGERVERVKISVPEDVVPRIEEGTTVSVSVDAAGLIGVPGEIVEVSSGSTQLGSLFPVEIALRGPATSQLRTGMAASVDIRLDTGSGIRYVVPPSAVLEDENGRHLFIVVPDEGSDPPTGTVERRNVQVSDLTDAGLTITSGLRVGDRVVTAGMSQLRDGMTVRSPE